MNDRKPVTAKKCNEKDRKPSADSERSIPISSCQNRSAYLSRNPNGIYMPSYNPVYYPGSYAHLSYPSTPLYNYPPPADHFNNVNVPVPNKMAMVLHSSSSQNWNNFNLLPSPLTVSSEKATTILKPHAITSNKNGSDRAKPPSPTKASVSSSSSEYIEYIDPKILQAVHALKLPPGGQKYSVEHWKGALALCYRWKTTTNEEERQFYRTSTTTNSLSSTTLKSIKFFCEHILQRKTKRRQFAIHWKESGLKKIVDESSSSDAPVMEYNNPKLERVIDDYFSGRTRSNGYNLAKEKVLEDRQKEILHLWDKLMSDPVLSKASSHQKLYLIQVAIERPYRNKMVEIETMNKKVIHDVAIEGYGGKSCWENSEPGSASDEKHGASGDPLLARFEQVLPINEMMNKRFWKCAGSCGTPERREKKRRVENDDESQSNGNKNSQQLPQNVDSPPSNEGSKMSATKFSGEDKENGRSTVVPI